MKPDFKFHNQEIHVWGVPLRPRCRIRDFEAILSPEELERIRRYKSDHAKTEFAIVRGVLRMLLGLYLDTTPKEIVISYGAWGKPEATGKSSTSFNVSHSGGQALIAISNCSQIGIDIEEVRALCDMRNIAERFFCREETVQLMSLPPAEQDAAFYRCWTRKEAYIKCVGAGLTIPLDMFQVTLRPANRARFIHFGGNYELACRWTISDISINIGNYAAAIAYPGEERPVHLFSIEDAWEHFARRADQENFREPPPD